MADQNPPEVARELRLIRQILFCILALGAAEYAIRISNAIIRPPGPDGEVLSGIRGELRELRQEVTKLRPPPAPPVVIPVNPPPGR